MARKGIRSPRHHPEWRILYGAVVIETRSARLSRKINAAEAAISLRLQELGDTQGAAAEREALQDARRTLRLAGKRLRQSRILPWRPSTE